MITLYKKDRVCDKTHKILGQKVQVIVHRKLINLGFGIVLEKDYDKYEVMSIRLNLPFISIEIDNEYS